MQTGARILVVEDEPSLLDTLEYSLAHEGYQVSTAADGLTALKVASEARPDLVILDIMLPLLDGLEVCRRLRRQMTMPILMLTARADEIDKVVGLEVGADDYMTKPFGMRELLARVRALLRRSQMGATADEQDAAPNASAGRVISGDLVIDTLRHEALRDGATLPLKPREYDLLLFLVQNRGVVLSRDLILERVWGWEYGGGSRTVDVHIRWLRERIEPDPSAPTRIQTVRGVGYRFEG